jgi:hypothetical protein
MLMVKPSEYTNEVVFFADTKKGFTIFAFDSRRIVEFRCCVNNLSNFWDARIWGRKLLLRTQSAIFCCIQVTLIGIWGD